MSISKDFRNIIDTLAKKGTQPLDAEGVVKRIDDGYAWVHLTDGVDETPVQLTINAQPGDKVRVRSAKGRMWITGNLSSPPTDDKVANEAKRIATSVGKGVSKQIGEIRTIADEAGELAGYAMESADGKSTVYHMATAPTGGDYKVGDTWFNSSEGYAIYTWNGTAWVKEELGSDAIANLAITNAKIANATIQSAKIAALDAGKITSGTISSARIDTANLTIGDTTLGSKVNDAETKATGFIYSDGNGIKIARTNPSGATTYQYLTSDKNQFYVNNDKVSEYGANAIRQGYGGADYFVIENGGGDIATPISWGEKSFTASGTSTTYFGITLSSDSQYSSKWSNLASGGSFFVNVQVVARFSGGDVKSGISLDCVKGTSDYIKVAASGGSNFKLSYNGGAYVEIAVENSSPVLYLVSANFEISGYENKSAPSFRLGVGTMAYDNALAVGKYNQVDKSGAFMVGVGTSAANRRNAFEIDWDGSSWFHKDMWDMDISQGITTTTGTLGSAKLSRWGNVVTLCLNVSNSANVAAGTRTTGANLYAGKIDTTALFGFSMMPTTKITSGSFVRGLAVNGAIDTDGTITIRNASTLILNAGLEVGIAFTYLTNN